MVAIALAHRFADDADRLVTGVGLRRLVVKAIGSLVLRWGRWLRSTELVQPGGECGLERLRISRCKLVFEREGPVCPGCESLGVNELLQFSD